MYHVINCYSIVIIYWVLVYHSMSQVQQSIASRVLHALREECAEFLPHPRVGRAEAALGAELLVEARVPADRGNRNPSPQLLPQITSLEKCNIKLKYIRNTHLVNVWGLGSGVPVPSVTCTSPGPGGGSSSPAPR